MYYYLKYNEGTSGYVSIVRQVRLFICHWMARDVKKKKEKKKDEGTKANFILKEIAI